MLQLQGALSKNVVEKRRAWKVTCCEFFSHFIILVLLVYGHSLAEVTYHPEKHYSKIEIVIPPVTEEEFLNIIEGPIPTLNLDTYVGLSRFINPDGSETNDFEQYSFITDFDNLLYLGTVHFAPDSAETAALIHYLNTTTASFSSLPHRVHRSESAAVDYILDHLDERALALIVLDRVGVGGVSYKLRLNYTTLPNTNQVVNNVVLGLGTSYQKYFFSSFLTFKNSVDGWVYNYTGVADSTVANSTTSCAKPNFLYTPYPTPSYDQNIFYTSIGFLLGLALAMSTLYPVSRLIKTVVEEKESRMRELMIIMGLRPWVLNLSWSMTAFVLYFWIALTSTLISTATFFPSSSKTLVFAYFFLFNMSEVPFCFIVSVFFNKAKIAAIVGPVALFAALLPRFIYINTNSYEEATGKYFASILSPSAFAFGADILSEYEYSGEGVQFYNMNEGAYSFSGCLRVMLVDVVLYCILAWYLGEAIPSEYGPRRHPLFFLKKSYWMGGGGVLAWVCGYTSGNGSTALTPHELLAIKELPDSRHDGNEGAASVPISSIEPLDDISKVRVSASCLRKRYADGKLAVKSLSFAMNEGQITCLLGHNGAGKSSVISMLTGLIPPTSGDCVVWGHRLTDELPAIRQITGVCPQQNVLFPMLTVEEHLMFFGKTKGLGGRELYTAIKDTLTEVGLSEKVNVLAHALSGGMKRKLCLAMALIGNPRFILLDEPTSGMDPYSRRFTWELLQRNKIGRTILLTTHFMDEADILADRILILSEGSLQCSGTSLFLKNTYGAGYVLSLAKADSKTPSEPITRFVQNIIPGAALHSAVSGEVVMNLPLSASTAFASLFEQLQGRLVELGVTGYGVSITTLEQVFLALAKIQHETGTEGAEENPEDQDRIVQFYFFRAVAHYLSACFRFFLMGASRVFGECRSCPDDYRGSSEVLSTGDCGVEQSKHVLADGVIDEEGLELPRRVPGSESPRDAPSNIGYSVVLGGEVNLAVDRVNGGDMTHSLQLETKNEDIGTPPKGILYTGVHPEPVVEDPEAGGTARRYTQGKVHIQMKELLGKRLTIQSRDANGFFFQIIFPALQILLILAVLTIDINPAGGSLDLDASAYGRIGERATTLYSPGTNESLQVAAASLQNNLEDVDLEQMLNDNANLMNNSILANFTNATLNNVSLGNLFDSLFYTEVVLSDDRQNVLNINNTANSSALSGHLLQTNNHSEGFRMGSYTFNDTVEADVTIDWDWVRDNQDNLLDNIEEVFSILDLLGVNSFSVAPSVSGRQVGSADEGSNPIEHIFLSEVFDIPSFREVLLLPQESAAAEGGFRLANILLPIVEQYYAYSSTSGRNELVPLAQEILRFHNDASSVPLSFAFSGLVFDNVSQDLLLSDLRLSFDDAASPGRVSFDVGDIFIPSAAVLAILPDGKETYSFVVPSLLTLLHNSSSAHAVAIFDGELARSLFGECGAALRAPVDGGPTQAKESVEYSTKNHPLPLTAQQSLTIQVILSIFASLLMLIPLCYLPSSFVTFVVRERVSMSKHLQLVSSISPYVYWTATYAYDVMLFVVLILCVFIALLSYGRDASQAFMGSVESSFALFFLLFSYGASIIPLCYIYSFAFENHSTAQISIMTWNFITGFVAVLAYFIMVNIESTKATGEALVHFFRFFPPYNIGEGLINISANYYYNKVLFRNTSYWSWEVAGRDIAFMGAEAVGYFLVVLLTESEEFLNLIHYIERTRTVEMLSAMKSSPVVDGEVDSDVSAEALTCQRSSPEELALLLVDIDKVYPPSLFGGDAKHAVRSFNLACPAGERFGLLGINGAGKTTTLGILTGGIQPTGGVAYIDGKQLRDPETRSLVGFCPQTDPLLDLMTGYETLWFFGRIRGMPEEFLEARVNSLVDRVGLRPHAHKPCGTYSGGNKRKLSLAVALVGDPTVLFLDEPSTGMDPLARRNMWDVITAVSEDKTVILTTHSMEECEALCTRIGIMVSGRLQCLGSSQHLKNKYGVSYEFEIRRCMVIETTDCFNEIQKVFASAELDEEHGSFFRVKTANDIDLAIAFATLEKMKGANKILSYSISQSTLEQIFIKFAAGQEEEKNIHDDLLER